MSFFELLKFWWNNEENVIFQFYSYDNRPVTPKRLVEEYKNMERQLLLERIRRERAEKNFTYIKNVNLALNMELMNLRRRLLE